MEQPDGESVIFVVFGITEGRFVSMEGKFRGNTSTYKKRFIQRPFKENPEAN